MFPATALTALASHDSMFGDTERRWVLPLASSDLFVTGALLPVLRMTGALESEANSHFLGMIQCGPIPVPEHTQSQLQRNMYI